MVSMVVKMLVEISDLQQTTRGIPKTSNCLKKKHICEKEKKA
jgi:hypothetical protein